MSIFTVTQKGTATDADDLLGKLRLFATANGFTEEDFKAGSRSGSILALSRNGTYFVLKSFIADAPYSAPTGPDLSSWQTAAVNDGIVCSLSTAYDTLDPWDNQEGYHTGGAPILQCDGAVVEYDFFYNGNVIHVACQYNSGKYSHLTFGDITKFGSYNDGGITSGTFYHEFDGTVASNEVNVRPSLYCDAPEDTGNPREYALVHVENQVEQVSGSVGTTGSNRESEIGGFDWTLDVKNSTNDFLSGKGTFIKGMFLKESSFTDYIPLGTIDGLYVAYFENYTSKELINVGTRYYVCIPFFEKTSPWDDTDTKSSGMGVIIEVNSSYVP